MCGSASIWAQHLGSSASCSSPDHHKAFRSLMAYCGCAVEESGVNGAYAASRGSAGASAVQQSDECPQPSDWDPSYR